MIALGPREQGVVKLARLRMRKHAYLVPPNPTKKKFEKAAPGTFDFHGKHHYDIRNHPLDEQNSVIDDSSGFQAEGRGGVGAQEA